MTLVAKLPRDIGLGSEFLDQVRQAGPASYSAGGFTITTALSTITRAVVTPDDSRIGAGADAVRAYDYTIAAGVITVMVYEASTVGAGPNSFAEIADTTDISAINFDAISVGEP